MAVVQCPNGHSYDNSRHARCPYCTGSQTIGVTVPLGVQETDGTGGGPQNGGVNGGFPRTMPVQGQMPAPGGVGVTEPYQNVTKALETRKPPKLSSSQLETLTIIAYYQPATKAMVEQIRGVDSAYSVAALLNKKLIEEAGRLNVPGRPIQYKTTSDFLRTFGLSSLEELPPIEKITFGEPVELPEQPPTGEDA